MSVRDHSQGRKVHNEFENNRDSDSWFRENIIESFQFIRDNKDGKFLKIYYYVLLYVQLFDLILVNSDIFGLFSQFHPAIIRFAF